MQRCIKIERKRAAETEKDDVGKETDRIEP